MMCLKHHADVGVPHTCHGINREVAGTERGVVNAVGNESLVGLI